MKKYIITMFMVAILSCIIGCGDFFKIKVKYEVTGSANRVDVTYENEDGGISQENNVIVPWSYSFKGDSGDFVYISAQNQGESGTVTVTIYKDGSKFKRSTSSGAYCIASASGSL